MGKGNRLKKRENRNIFKNEKIMFPCRIKKDGYAIINLWCFVHYLINKYSKKDKVIEEFQKFIPLSICSFEICKVLIENIENTIKTKMEMLRKLKENNINVVEHYNTKSFRSSPDSNSKTIHILPIKDIDNEQDLIGVVEYYRKNYPELEKDILDSFLVQIDGKIVLSSYSIYFQTFFDNLLETDPEQRKLSCNICFEEFSSLTGCLNCSYTMCNNCSKKLKHICPVCKQKPI